MAASSEIDQPFVVAREVRALAERFEHAEAHLHDDVITLIVVTNAAMTVEIDVLPAGYHPSRGITPSKPTAVRAAGLELSLVHTHLWDISLDSLSDLVYEVIDARDQLEHGAPRGVGLLPGGMEVVAEPDGSYRPTKSARKTDAAIGAFLPGIAGARHADRAARELADLEAEYGAAAVEYVNNAPSGWHPTESIVTVTAWDDSGETGTRVQFQLAGIWPDAEPEWITVTDVHAGDEAGYELDATMVVGTWSGSWDTWWSLADVVKAALAARAALDASTADPPVGWGDVGTAAEPRAPYRDEPERNAKVRVVHPRPTKSAYKTGAAIGAFIPGGTLGQSGRATRELAELEAEYGAADFDAATTTVTVTAWDDSGETGTRVEIQLAENWPFARPVRFGMTDVLEGSGAGRELDAHLLGYWSSVWTLAEVVEAALAARAALAASTDDWQAGMVDISGDTGGKVLVEYPDDSHPTKSARKTGAAFRTGGGVCHVCTTRPARFRCAGCARLEVCGAVCQTASWAAGHAAACGTE